MSLVDSTRSPTAAETLPAASCAMLTAYVLVSTGSSLHGDLLLMLSVPLTTAGFALACLAARRGLFDAAWPLSRVTMLLSALAAIGLVAPATSESLLWFTLATRTFFAISIVLVGVYAGGDGVIRRRVRHALLAGAIGLQFAAPFGVHVTVDLWSWTQAATLALLHGVHPYTVHAPDLQHGGYDFGSTPTVYPYMPLSLIAAAPWVALLGDYRFGIACCLPLSVALFRKAGRALQVDATLVDVLTLALVLHPFGTWITATGYIEPLLVTMAAAFLFFAVTAPGGNAEATAYVLLPALKQYAVAPTLLYVAMRGRARSVGVAAAVALASIAPFLWWEARPTIDGMFYFVRAPLAFRTDSDSIGAVIFAVSGREAPRMLAVIVQFAAAVVAYRGLRGRGLEGLLLASALSLLASFLVAPQAFTNYYYFAGAMLLLASLTAAGRRSET